MDDTFFKAVNRRLKELEAEREQRYQQPDESQPRARDYLYKHPMFATTPSYWFATDRLVDGEYFDWDSDKYPNDYITIVNAVDLRSRHKIASRPYVLADDGYAMYENTKTLVARLSILGFLDLL